MCAEVLVLSLLCEWRVIRGLIGPSLINDGNLHNSWLLGCRRASIQLRRINFFVAFVARRAQLSITAVSSVIEKVGRSVRVTLGWFKGGNQLVWLSWRVLAPRWDKCANSFADIVSVRPSCFLRRSLCHLLVCYLLIVNFELMALCCRCQVRKTIRCRKIRRIDTACLMGTCNTAQGCLPLRWWALNRVMNRDCVESW